MTSCAATTTIREALEIDEDFGLCGAEDCGTCSAVAALVSLEQLVEAAQEVGRVEREVVATDLASERGIARRALARALAAVGPGTP